MLLFVYSIKLKQHNMEKELVEQLEKSLIQIQNAFVKRDRRSKENAYIYAISHIQRLQLEIFYKWDEYRRQGLFIVGKDVSEFTDWDLDTNLRFCVEIITERMRTNFSSPISPNATQILLFSPKPLQQETVLYEEKSEDGNEKRLKVSDFLDVLKYAKKFAEASLDVDFDRYNGGLLAIQTVELAINHKPVDKPLNKALHIANDVLTEFAKSLSKDKGTKRTASGISLLVDLAIDFLVRG